MMVIFIIASLIPPQALLYTFSHIYFTLTSSIQDDELLVGRAAVQANAGPANTISSFKRLMGRKASEVATQLADQVSYPILEGDRGEAMIYCAGADDLLSPEELSSWLLQHLVRTAQLYLKESVTGAVLTVPAHFNPRQRNATFEAAKLAGIGTVHLLQEPVAAALAYGIDGETDGETVLVFDIGGGTFDISILQAFEGIMQVLGTSGDSRLGGDDFDALIADWILEELKIGNSGSDTVREWALGAAREAKESLSYASSAKIVVGLTALDQGNTIDLTQEIFEDLTGGLFLKMASVLEYIGREVFVEWAVPPRDAVPCNTSTARTAAQDNNTSSSDISNSETSSVDKWAPPPRRISKVALVGEITRLPSVRKFVETLTGVPPCISIDPGAAVALGAATQAGILLGSVGSVELMDGSFVVDLHSRVTGFSDWEP